MNDTSIFMTDEDRRGSTTRRGGGGPQLEYHLSLGGGDGGAAGLQSRRPAGQSTPATYSYPAIYPASNSIPNSLSNPLSNPPYQTPSHAPAIAPAKRRPSKPPASNAYVRYLLDSQLFNVPGNHEKFRMLLSYLHAERIFDVTYVVAMQTSKLRDNVDRRWWTSADQREKLAQRNRRRGGRGNCGGDLEDEKCTNLFNETCSTQIGAGNAARNLDREMFSTRRHTTLGAGVLHPIDAYDARDFLQNVKLTGDEDEWLDLKIQLCLPSVLFFVKLKGSATRVPNADYTVLVDMKQLQMLQTTETIGEKLARILASVRKRFLNADTPDFDRLQLWSEMDEEVEEAGDGEENVLAIDDANGRYTGTNGGGLTQALVPSSQALAIPAADPYNRQMNSSVMYQTQAATTVSSHQQSPNSYDAAPTNYEDPPLFYPATQTESKEDQDEKKRKRDQYRRMYSNSNITSVYKIAEG